MAAIRPGSMVQIRGCGLAGDVVADLGLGRYIVTVPLLGAVCMLRLKDMQSLPGHSPEDLYEDIRGINEAAAAYTSRLDAHWGSDVREPSESAPASLIGRIGKVA